MDPTEFVEEYARRFNEASEAGDFSRMSELRTEDATVLLRAPDAPELSGRVRSVGESLPRGATLDFTDVQVLDDGRVRARLSGDGYPPGQITGTAWFTLQDDKLTGLEIELDEDVDLRRGSAPG